MKPFNLGGKPPEDKTPRTGDRREAGSDCSYGGPERRGGADRRGLSVGLKFKTSQQIGPIEDWLDQNFPGKHQLSIEGFSDDLIDRNVRVVFATEDQREAFKSVLSYYLLTGEIK